MQIGATLQFHFSQSERLPVTEQTVLGAGTVVGSPYKLLVGMGLHAATVEIITKGPP